MSEVLNNRKDREKGGKKQAIMKKKSNYKQYYKTRTFYNRNFRPKIENMIGSSKNYGRERGKKVGD